MLSVFYMYSVQCWEEEIMTFGKDLMKLWNYHVICLDRRRQYARKSVSSVPRSKIKPDTSWVQVWSVQARGEKNSHWLRLLNFRPVFRLNNLHFLQSSDTCCSNLPLARKCYTHRTPNAGLWLWGIASCDMATLESVLWQKATNLSLYRLEVILKPNDIYIYIYIYIYVVPQR